MNIAGPLLKAAGGKDMAKKMLVDFVKGAMRPVPSAVQGMVSAGKPFRMGGNVAPGVMDALKQRNYLQMHDDVWRKGVNPPATTLRQDKALADRTNEFLKTSGKDLQRPFIPMQTPQSTQDLSQNLLNEIRKRRSPILTDIGSPENMLSEQEKMIMELMQGAQYRPSNVALSPFLHGTDGGRLRNVPTPGIFDAPNNIDAKIARNVFLKNRPEVTLPPSPEVLPTAYGADNAAPLLRGNDGKLTSLENQLMTKQPLDTRSYPGMPESYGSDITTPFLRTWHPTGKDAHKERFSKHKKHKK